MEPSIGRRIHNSRVLLVYVSVVAFFLVLLIVELWSSISTASTVRTTALTVMPSPLAVQPSLGGWVYTIAVCFVLPGTLYVRANVKAARRFRAMTRSSIQR